MDLVLPASTSTAAPNEAVLSFNRWGGYVEPELVRIDVTLADSVTDKTTYSKNRTFTVEHMLSGQQEQMHVPLPERGAVLSVVRSADGVELHSTNVWPGRNPRGAFLSTLDLSPTADEAERVNVVSLASSAFSSGRSLPEFADTYRGIAAVAVRTSELSLLPARQHDVLMAWVDQGGTLFLACDKEKDGVCGELGSTFAKVELSRTTTHGLGTVVYTKQPSDDMFELARDEYLQRRFSGNNVFGQRYFHYEEATYRTLGLGGLLLAFGVIAGPLVAWRRRRAGKPALPLRWVAASSTLAFGAIALVGRVAAPSSHVETVRVHTQSSGALHGNDAVLRTFFQPPAHLVVSRIGSFPVRDSRADGRGAFYIDRDDKIVLNETGAHADYVYVVEQSSSMAVDVKIECHTSECVVHNGSGHVLGDVQFAHRGSVKEVAARLGSEPVSFDGRAGNGLSYGDRNYDSQVYEDLDRTRGVLLATMDLGKNETVILRIVCGASCMELSR